MKKLIFLLLIIFSCEKAEIKEKCWTCTEYSDQNVVRTWEECDALKAAEQNGKRWITYVWYGNVSKATLHTINCK